MTYLIHWITKNPAESIAMFQKSGHDLPKGVAIVGSWHVVGEGKGVVVVTCDDPKLIHAVSASWSKAVDITVSQVITDEEAKAALKDVKA
jgi:hypothetical protein